MSPMNLAEYHPDWPWISRQIRDQAGNVCEWCQAPNGAIVQRNIAGAWMLLDDLDAMQSDAGWSWLGTYDPPMPVTIVLTVHHQCSADGCDKRTCSDPSHMAAVCQRCHFAAERSENQAKAAITRGRKRRAAIAATGQQEMQL